MKSDAGATPSSPPPPSSRTGDDVECAASAGSPESGTAAPARVSGRVRPARRSAPRPKVIATTRVSRAATKMAVEVGRLLHPVVDVERPKTRGECADVPRPCPFVGCRHSLYLDINPATGSIKLNHPGLEPWELKHSCALDVADLGGITLEEVGRVTNLTRERIRQVEVQGLINLKRRSAELDKNWEPGARENQDSYRTGRRR